jgi:phosphoadenosine phosphosulfate reductase
MFADDHPGGAAVERDPVEALATRLRERHGGASARELLELAIRTEFAGKIAAVSSFGAESAVILALVAEIEPATPVVFLDTGKHFPETLAYRDQLVARLGLTDVRSIVPTAADLQRDDPDGRLHQADADRCCNIRKVLPLERALNGFAAWITGRKRYQGGDRSRLPAVEAVDSRIKINPLAAWTPAEIIAEFHRRQLPRHPLVAEGYLSIGCVPCTARVASGQPSRSGRWTDSDKTECGIHRAKWAPA